MKTVCNKSLKTVITGLLLMAVAFMGCEKSDPLSANSGHRNISEAAQDGLPNFLSFKNANNSLHKKKGKKKWVTKSSGDVIEVSHGDASGTIANAVYATDWNPPYNVYQIDPSNPATTSLVGQLAFKSAGIAMHPYNGLVHYVGVDSINGVFPVGVWDPETNTNTLLPNGSSFRPTGKLAFRSDGVLFGMGKSNTSKLYTINTNSGSWTLFATLDKKLKIGGDMAFNKDGSTLYSSGGSVSTFTRVDMATFMVTNLGSAASSMISGLAFGADDNLYYTIKRTGEVGFIDLDSGDAIAVGYTDLPEINDIAPVIAATELAYANLSLEVLPSSIDVDKEIEVSIETTELTGGVWVTFEPHGTVFSPPAVLNFTAHGVDFSGIDPNTVDIYYDNPETGQWELMARDDVIVDVNTGTLQVMNARLPHFSRYGVAAD